jgi:hypothetical protein
LFDSLALPAIFTVLVKMLFLNVVPDMLLLLLAPTLSSVPDNVLL